MKLRIKEVSAKTGGDLHNLAKDITITKSGVLREPDVDDPTILIIDDKNAPPSQKMKMDEAKLLSILAADGEMTEHLMAIRATNAIVNTLVPDGLPIRKDAGKTVKTFIQWFLPGAEIWTEDVGNGIIFYTNPAAGLASAADYLTGSQMNIIRKLNTGDYSILSTKDADAVTATGWTVLDWENL